VRACEYVAYIFAYVMEAAREQGGGGGGGGERESEKEKREREKGESE